jgi:thiaminase/transcriptional activator TenA
VDAYGALLGTLPTLAYPASVAALWAVERAYLDAWRTAAPGATEYQAFVEHWTTRQFAEYVLGLEGAADRALADAGSEVWDAASDAVAEVARQEAAFWDMAC